jgi:outer membrane receptor for ferric coprogen and ferric-rhodotorulic acid
MKRQVRIAAMLCSAAVLVQAAPVRAQANAAESQAREFDVPAQPLAQAVLAFSQQAGVQLVLESGTAQGMSSSPVKGRMSVAEAITRLLAGTSLTWRFVNDRTVTIEAAPQGSNGEHVLGAVRVEGEQRSPYFGGAGQMAGVNGVNGSRDITATEGTKSFTSGALTVGSKVPQAIKDVPQSVSVLTSERLQQQNVTDFTSAMQQLPGITLVQGITSLENAFYSRGFQVTSVQVDGGAPLATSGAAVWGLYPQIDMSIYDHVELVRGADGQFGSYGDPGGTVNLVRKKPLDHPQVTLEGQAGSWSNYRVVADATAPLALDGRLRGRLVMTWQNDHHFYDIAKDDKALIYGIAEFDATPTTLLTAGINYTRQHSVPWQGGLPRFLNGGDLQLPRSTCLCFSWNRWDMATTEIFGGVEQKIADDWKLKVNVTDNRQSNTQKIGYSQGAVNPTNDRGPVLNGVYADVGSKQLSAEAVLTGAVTIFGQRQEITIGANRVKSDAGGTTDYARLVGGTSAAPYQPYAGGPTFYSGSPNGSFPPIDVFNFNPGDPLYTEPRNPLATTVYPVFGSLQEGAYVNLRLTAFDRLHLNASVRWSRFEYHFAEDDLCTTTSGLCAGMQIGDVYSTVSEKYHENDVSWPPSGSLSYDITRRLTAYVGYTDIYQSQAYDLDSALKPLPPVTGSNIEAGLKWAARDGKLNLAVAAYTIKQKGFGIPDPPDYSNYYQVAPGVYCCFVADPNAVERSKGIDVDATGEILRGWQIAASYTYNENKSEGDYFGVPAGSPTTPIVSIQPKHLYKLWTTYDFGAAGHKGALSRLALSLGVNAQSSGFNSGTTCVRLDDTIPPNSITGAQPCQPDGYEDYQFTVPAYAVVSGRIDYRLSGTWWLALNLENVFDKTYYQTAGTTVTRGFWYGAPRSVTATLRAKW